MQKAFYPVFTSLQNGKKLAFYPVKKNAKMHESFKKKSNLVNLYEGKYAFQIINVDYKSCIVREPLERFISAYKNRVLFHKDKNFYKHSVSEVIEKLENGNVENKHFLPQSFFLGNDLSYFDIVGSLSNIKSFEEKINNFFGKKKVFPKLQVGGKEFHKIKLFKN